MPISKRVDFDGTFLINAFVVHLEAVFEMVGRFEIEDGGYVFLICGDGMFIVHPDPKYAPTDSRHSMADSARTASPTANEPW